MKLKYRILPFVFLLAIVELVQPHRSYAKTTCGLEILCYRSVSISECAEEPPNAILAGSVGEIFVTRKHYRTPDVYDGLKEEWPEGLTIEAGVILDGKWVIQPGLAERMHLRRWFWSYAVVDDSLARTTGKPVSDDTRRESYSWNFMFEIPSELKGKTIFFNAIYVNDDSDTLTNKIPDESYRPRNQLAVVAPCSSVDSNRVRGACVYFAMERGDWTMSIHLADSLIAEGWHDVAGLEAAGIAAFNLRDSERQLRYLDLNYLSNHKLSFLLQKDSSGTEEFYRAKRYELLQGIQKR